MKYGLLTEVTRPPPPPVAESGKAVPAVAPLAPTEFWLAKFPNGPSVMVALSVVAPLKVVLPEKVDVPACVRLEPAPNVMAPLAVKAVVDRLAKEPAPEELI